MDESLIARYAQQSGLAMADSLLTFASFVGNHAAGLAEDFQPTGDCEHVPVEQCSVVTQEVGAMLRAHFERS